MFSTNPLESAEEAGLRYVKCDGLCIRRVRSGKAFRYVGPDGKTVRDPKHLSRIRSLVIPPAWTDVAICPTANGHLQAVGVDARGRKQYRYHPRYREVRDQAKFSRMIAFGTTLGAIRLHVKRDLARHGLPKEKVLATILRLLETSYIRVGNDEYARENDSFGLTTMKDRHVCIAGAKLTFRFRGKSGQNHSIQLTDRRLARIVKSCRDLPGYELFQYTDRNGQIHAVDSGDVNRYIREISGQDFTAKDFRTWAGARLALRELCAAGPCSSERDGNRNIVAAIKATANLLGNRPATCRKYYVHPAILEAYLDGSLSEVMERGRQQEVAYRGMGLSAEEYSVIVIIAAHQEKLAKKMHSKVA